MNVLPPITNQDPLFINVPSYGHTRKKRARRKISKYFQFNRFMMISFFVLSFVSFILMVAIPEATVAFNNSNLIGPYHILTGILTVSHIAAGSMFRYRNAVELIESEERFRSLSSTIALLISYARQVTGVITIIAVGTYLFLQVNKLMVQCKDPELIASDCVLSRYCNEEYSIAIGSTVYAGVMLLTVIVQMVFDYYVKSFIYLHRKYF